MKIFKSITLLAIIFFLNLVSVSAYSLEPQMFFRGIRPLGMGGAFTAVSDDNNAIFYNPAGITQRQGSLLTAFELPINFSDDIFNFYQFYQDNENDLTNFDKLSYTKQISLLNKINSDIVNFKPNIRLGIPNISYISSPGYIQWGFGLLDQVQVGFQFNRSLIVPSVSYWGNADALAAVPLAHKFCSLPYSIPGSLSAGATLKYLYRGKIAEYNKSVLAFEDLNPTLQMGKGFGADLGALYQPNDRLNLGLQITDINGTKLGFDEVKSTKAGEADKPAFTGEIPSQINAGAAYTPKRIYYWPKKSISTKDRLIFALDVRDISNSDEPLFDATFWKKIHMGVEFRVSTLSLRGGFNSGYPSFGAGIRVPYLGLKAEYAFWGDELSRYAGQLPEWNHQITISLSWGDSKGRPYGSSCDTKPAEKKPLAKPIVEKTKEKLTDAPSTQAPAVTPAPAEAPVITPKK
jgi:hypothetical protein